MKTIFSALAVALVMASCTAGPREKTQAQAATTDTAGLAEFRAMKMQTQINEAYKAGQQSVLQQQLAAPVATRTVSTPARRTSTTTRRSSSPDYSMNSESSNAAKTSQKKGWSKAAKGAAIGGASGAVLGAVINKKNRAVGGVVGGVLGGGVGYGIGRGMDKRDGRY